MLAKSAVLGVVALFATTISGSLTFSSASASTQFAGLDSGSSPLRTCAQMWDASEGIFAETAVDDDPALILAQGLGRTGDDNGGGGVFGRSDPGSSAGRGLESNNNGDSPDAGQAGVSNMGEGQGGDQGGYQGGGQGGEQGGTAPQGGGENT